jgi:uncharacterized paraquat-inducible protein A
MIGAQPGVPAGSVVCRKCGVITPEGGTCSVCGEKQQGSTPSTQSRRVSLLIAIAMVVLGAAVAMQSMLCVSPGAGK